MFIISIFFYFAKTSKIEINGRTKRFWSLKWKRQISFDLNFDFDFENEKKNINDFRSRH